MAITAVHRGIQAATVPTEGFDPHLVIVALTAASGVLILLRELEQVALLVALGASIAQVVIDHPHAANHAFLENLVLVLAMLLGDRQSPRLISWMPTVAGLVLVWAALQKVANGTYLTGHTLAVFALEDSRFAALKALGPRSEAGCYQPSSSLVAVSVLTVVGELMCGAGVCWPRTRRIAALGAVILVVGIQAFAREFTFAGLMIGLLLLSFPPRWSTVSNYGLAGAFVVGACVVAFTSP